MFAFKSILLLLFFSLKIGSENEWEKSLDKDDIVIYTRSVETSQFKEFLAEAEMVGTVAQFRKIITNIDQYPKWLPDCKSTQRIENPTADEITYQMKLKVPFPFANRDIIQQINLIESDNELIVKIKSQPNKVKKEKNYVRMLRADGRWVIKQITDDRISIKFQYLADPGGGVPSWLVNTFIVKNPHKTLKNIRKLMAK